jgi:hypothetical protein
LTTNDHPTNAKHTTTIVVAPFFQYGASVAGYTTIPQNVYKICPPIAIVYKIIPLTASSPSRCRIVLAQPYISGFTMKLVPHR